MTRKNNIKEYTKEQRDYIKTTLNILLMKLDKGFLDFYQWNQYLNEALYVVDNPENEK